MRVISASANGENWIPIASALNVNMNTARRWVRTSESGTNSGQHGGKRYKKLNEIEVNEMLQWIGDNPCSTLKELQLRLKVEFNKEICLSTIRNYLEGKLVTVKKVRYFSETMNSQENLEKRRR